MANLATRSSLLLAIAALCGFGLAAPTHAQGTLEQIHVMGASLRGNLEGDDPNRTVYVYLPPGYAKSGKRYPVIYFLHSYAVNAKFYVDTIGLPAAADKAIAAGAHAAIVVFPDAYTIYNGSMYSNSPTTGDCQARQSRPGGALDGRLRHHAHCHALSTGFRRHLRHERLLPAEPGAGQVSGRSSACRSRGAGDADCLAGGGERCVAGPAADFCQGAAGTGGRMGTGSRQSAAVLRLAIRQRRAPTIGSGQVDRHQHVPALQSFHAIMLDVGDKDGLSTTNKQLDAALTRLKVSHGFETYDGDHVNRVPQRFAEKVLPFFSRNLKQE